MLAMRRTPTLIATAALAVTSLSGCASQGASPGAVATPASAPAPVADPAADPAASAPPSATACTSNACLTDQIEHDLLTSVVAKDGAVVTKAKCKSSTLRRNAGGSYTVSCKVTESDGGVADGYANLIPSQQEITWDPTDIIAPPGG